MSRVHEYFQILIGTNWSHFLTDIESINYLIFIAGLVIVLPVTAVFGGEAGIVISILITLPALFITWYGLSWGKSHSQIFSPALIGLGVTCLVVFASNLYFADLIRCCLIPLEVPHWQATVVYVLLFFSLPIGYFLWRFLEDASPALKYISMDFQISNDYRHPVFVDSVSFVNSRTGKQVTYGYLNAFANSDEFIPCKIFEAMSLRDQFRHRLEFLHDGSSAGLSPKSDSDKYQIPIGTDQFVISWYSFVEDKYYSDSFDFPLSKLKIDKVFNLSYHRYVRQANLLTLQLFPGGLASLTSGLSSSSTQYGGKVLANYGKIAEKPLEQYRKEEFLAEYLRRREYKGSAEELRQELTHLKQMKISQRLQDQLVLYDWSVSLHKKGEKTGESITPNVEVISGHNEQLKTRMDSNLRSSLPLVLEFYFEKGWYDIYFNSDELTSMVIKHGAEFKSESGKTAIKFEILLDVADYKKTMIQLVLEDKVIPFQSFEIYLK